MKAYEQLGLTAKQVIEMQRWLFRMVAETDSISKMIDKTVDKFPAGTTRHYALYILGNRMGEAQMKEQLGMTCILNPEQI